MKYLFAAVFAAGIFVVVFGTPLPVEKPARAHYYGSPEPILPMSFAHADHAAESCIECHHNYIDDTGNELCMNCHVSDSELLDVLLEQYHDLCQGCHAKKAAETMDGGPPRSCIACHMGDDLP